MQTCANCGAQVSDQDVFCGDCGARVRDAPAAPVGAGKATTDVISKEEPTRRRFPLTFAAIGCAAVLAVLCICGALGYSLVSRSATSTQRVSVPTSALLFEDTFDNNTGEWSVWVDEQGEKGVEDGVYYVTVNETEWASWGTSGTLTFTDGVIEVEAEAVDGPDDNGYGLVFRYQDNDNFYYYEVSSDGYYSIGKMVADEWETLVGWTESDLIRLGRRTNTLRVDCDGPEMTFFVNDYPVETLTDNDFASGGVGFLAEAVEEAGVRVHFDNLKIWAAE